MNVYYIYIYIYNYLSNLGQKWLKARNIGYTLKIELIVVCLSSLLTVTLREVYIYGRCVCVCVYFYISYSCITGPLAKWVECSLIVRETGVQYQVESYQRIKEIVLDAALINTQHYKVAIKGKVEQSREWSSAFPYTSV